MTYFLLYLLVGSVSGVMAGLLGVGGGLVIVPVLLYLFHVQAFSPDVAMHMAIGTSLAAVTVTAISSTRAHHKRGTVEWSLWAKLAPGLVIGSLLGAVIAHALHAATLRNLFGVFELLAAANVAWGAQPQGQRFPGTVVTIVIATGIGIVCALAGIGGGIMVVPLLLWCGVPIKNAVSTSAATGLPIALAGAIGFTLLGSGTSTLPDGSSGYVYWPALVGIGITSVLSAPYGAKLAHSLSPTALRKAFAVFLAVLGVLMLLGH